MRRFQVSIELEGEALESSPQHELARILRALARDLSDYYYPHELVSGAGRSLLDVNGNTCGAWTVRGR